MCSCISACSSVASMSAGGSGSRSKDVLSATARSASSDASATPTPTAITRSNTTVAAAVVSSSTASPRVERTIRATVPNSTIRTAVTIRTPASAASGIRASRPASANTETSRTTLWTTVATRVCAPARTLTAVRAIAPVAGIPPMNDTATLASPWPSSSRSGSCGSPSAIPSATLAESRLSRAASAATASTADRSVGRSVTANSGTCGYGRPAGMCPIRATGRSASSATTVATRDRDQRCGQGPVQTRQDDHRRHDQRDDRQRRPVPAAPVRRPRGPRPRPCSCPRASARRARRGPAGGRSASRCRA